MTHATTFRVSALLVALLTATATADQFRAEGPPYDDDPEEKGARHQIWQT